MVNDIKNKDIDFSDIPELDEAWFKQAEIIMPKNKKAVSIRIDEDVFNWLKSQGADYQARINAILRAYYQAHK